MRKEVWLVCICGCRSDENADRMGNIRSTNPDITIMSGFARAPRNTVEIASGLECKKHSSVVPGLLSEDVFRN